MTTPTLRTLALGFGLALIAVPPAADAQANVRLAVQQNSKLWLEGGSNLHDWSCKAESVDATIEVAANFTPTNDPAAMKRGLRRVEVRVPVGNIDCGNGTMNKNLYKALKASEAPRVTYIMGTFDAAPGEAQNDLMIKALGRLTVAGVANEVRAEVTAARLADGSMRATGTVPLLMTDFGIEPPRALLGTLRTHDRVLVKFDLVVGPQTMIAAGLAP